MLPSEAGAPLFPNLNDPNPFSTYHSGSRSHKDGFDFTEYDRVSHDGHAVTGDEAVRPESRQSDPPPFDDHESVEKDHDESSVGSSGYESGFLPT